MKLATLRDPVEFMRNFLKAGRKDKKKQIRHGCLGFCRVQTRVTEFRHISVIPPQSSNFPNSESLAVFAGSPQMMMTMRMMKMVVTVMTLTRETTFQDPAIGVMSYINTSIHVQKQGNDLNYS